ncbi:hypothetical protein ACS3YM_14250 [Nocardia sp. N13]|uniref:hypothetical protein n=1 Tax=Nocardioides sp. N13(2025) TaxID=3453405 RepID=UPI003F76F95A
MTAFAVFLVAIVGFTVLKNAGLLSPFGIKSEAADSQVVQSIKRTEEVSLLALGIQGITSEERCSTAFGKCIPGTSDEVYLQYTFTGKLGIDGAAVDVRETGADAYTISIPAFEVIGYSDPEFEVAVTDDGVLSWVTEDIDQTEMITKILGEDAQQKHLEDNEDLLQEQTKAFYDNIILSVAPEAKITYEFA